MVWQSTLELNRMQVRTHQYSEHEAMVVVGCQIRPMRDWILVQAIDHVDVTTDVARTLGCLAVKTNDHLSPRIAGAAAMLMVAESYPADVIECMLRLCPGDSLGQLVAEGFRAGIPGDQVRVMLHEARPIVERILNTPGSLPEASAGLQ